MKRLLIILFVTGMTFGLQTRSEAVLLFNDPIFFGGGVSPLTDGQVTLKFGYFFDPLSEIFNYSFDITDTAAIGTMATSVPGDPGFDAFVGWLTDGNPQLFKATDIFSTTTLTYNTSEDVSVGGSLFSTNGVDLAGSNIAMLKTTLREVGPFAQGYSFTADFQIFGDPASAAVPEPATMILFGSGLAGAFLRRKRRA